MDICVELEVRNESEIYLEHPSCDRVDRSAKVYFRKFVDIVV